MNKIIDKNLIHSNDDETTGVQQINDESNVPEAPWEWWPKSLAFLILWKLQGAAVTKALKTKKNPTCRSIKKSNNAHNKN